LQDSTLVDEAIGAQISYQMQLIVESINEHKRDLARVVQKASFAYVALFERMVSEMTRIAQANRQGMWSAHSPSYFQLS